MAEKKSIENPFLRRYTPFDRFSLGDGFAIRKAVVEKFFDYGESITDKESYRLHLASGRGTPLGTPTAGQYMYPDGKYNSSLDFSFVYRKDLTVQEYDNYIEMMTARRKDADSELAARIDAALAELEKNPVAAIKKQQESVEGTPATSSE